MTELQKYIGPGEDLPGMGVNCGTVAGQRRDGSSPTRVEESAFASANFERNRRRCGRGAMQAEIGYLYGQYKRTAHEYSRHGRGLLWGGAFPHPEVFGFSPVHFAKHMLEARGDSLRGKRCLVTGSGKVALAVAERLLALGAVGGGARNHWLDAVTDFSFPLGARRGR